jgi:N-acetylmuramoyl-L-alanine amidase
MSSSRRPTARLAALLAACAAGCDGAPPALPPLPAVDGPVAARLVSPAPGEVLPPFGRFTVYGSVGSGRAALRINGISVPVLPNGSFLARIPVPPNDSARYELVATVAGDTARLVVPVRVPALDPPAARVPAATAAPWDAVLRIAPDGDGPRDRIPARPAPGGVPEWFLFPGTPVRVMEVADGVARVRLDAAAEAWVRLDEVERTAAGGMPRVGVARVHTAGTEWDEIVVPMDGVPAVRVQPRADGLDLVLHGTRTAEGAVPGAGWIRTVRARQAGPDRAVVEVRTPVAPFGWEVERREGALVLRVRRPPRVQPRAPLRGLVIAVDAGHPPAGATGPTGLREHEVTLAVAIRLRRMLEARGARVVMTRDDPSPVELAGRIAIARRAGAHAVVSIHADSRPGGVDPRAAGGTRTYYHHPAAARLAEAVQAGMTRRMGLPDRGVHRDALALVRGEWAPSVLCEGAMLILPEHENALRRPDFQEAYARGIADGLEAFFAGLATP